MWTVGGGNELNNNGWWMVAFWVDVLVGSGESVFMYKGTFLVRFVGIR